MNTEWLGLKLDTPFVPSASPLSRSLDASRTLEDSGAGALVMHSLFEEVIAAEEEGMARFLHDQDQGHPESDATLADQDFHRELDRYLEQITALKSALSIPVVASLNGISNNDWLHQAREIEEAGADALELNVYHIATGIEQNSTQVEQRYIELLQALVSEIRIPINMKLPPFFSSPGHMVWQLQQAGAAGVSLFNRFYQPDINVHDLTLQPSLHPSGSHDALMPMRWIAILHGRVQLSLGATSGIHTSEDAIKLLLAGADVVHLCTALLQQGPEHLRTVIEGLEKWMGEHDFQSLDDFRGCVSQRSVADTASFERANYKRVLDNYTFKPAFWT